MSPRKAATAKPAERRGAPAKSAAKPKVVAEAASQAATSSVSAEATALAATIERGLQQGNLDVLTPQALQVLMAALCKIYGAQVEAGRDFLPLADRQSVSPTEVMTTTSGILKAANLAVFELGMWQSWTGR
jgi:hypothetical protein